MTPTQQFAWILFAAAAFQVWMMIYRPEQYQHELDRRDRNIKGVANATARVVTFFLSRR